jgi:hypothetical protein
MRISVMDIQLMPDFFDFFFFTKKKKTNGYTLRIQPNHGPPLASRWFGHLRGCLLTRFICYGHDAYLASNDMEGIGLHGMVWGCRPDPSSVFIPSTCPQITFVFGFISKA